ncbi:hypothetical protein Hypma_003027 [Hypsizygus marmoreus]|uniref:F-box domain-containing protein n=1 Tax=Hypsizygus marmoreus TaxID=39966 RepID=A0A369J519_HYPMA|nr:hypothetical protein Hypma_003027 [Hypsizygus marmoreus]
MVFSILRHIADDSESMASCALVSRDWSEFCQQNFFHYVRIYNSERCGRLLHLLEDSPHLIHFIRVLSISSPTYSLGPDDPADFRLDWQDSHSEMISRTLHLLENLQDLDISFGRACDNIDEPGRVFRVGRVLNEAYRSVISVALGMPSIASLTLRECILSSGVVDIQHLLQNAVTLKSLTISCESAASESLDLQTLDPVERRVRLEALRMHMYTMTSDVIERHFYDWIWHPRCVLDLRGLRRLELTGCRNPVLLSTFLKTDGMSQGLEHLYLAPCFARDNLMGLDFSCCHNLQALDIDLVYTTFIPGCSPPEWLCHSLRTIAPTASLQRVFVAIPVILDEEGILHNPVPLPDGDTIRADWRRLNDVLASQRLQCISSLTVSVAYECDNPVPYQKVVEEELTADHVDVIDHRYQEHLI